jgi:hypothetical protein
MKPTKLPPNYHQITNTNSEFFRQLRLTKIGLYLFCFFSLFSAKATVDFSTYGTLESCYQSKDFNTGNGQIFTFLNMGGSGQFRFGTYGGNMQVYYARIEVLDQNGVYQDIVNLGGGSGLSSGIFDWVTHVQNGNSFPAIEILKTVNGQELLNTGWFAFGNYPSARITSLDEFGATLRVSDLNFVNTLEEAVSFEPTEGSCFQFTPFNLSASTLLDGLCNFVGSNVELKPVSGSPIEPYLSSNFSLSFPVFQGGSKATDKTQNIGINNWCDQCAGISAEHHQPGPITCGCADFELTFTLEPCDGAPAECLPLSFTKNIQICCSCDIRSSAPLD